MQRDRRRDARHMVGIKRLIQPRKQTSFEYDSNVVRIPFLTVTTLFLTVNIMEKHQSEHTIEITVSVELYTKN